MCIFRYNLHVQKYRPMSMTFKEWEEKHKAALKKVAEQTHTSYSDLLARMDYVWENGRMDTGQHFETQCPLFGEMDKKTPLFKLGRSAFYHSRQKKWVAPRKFALV